MKSFFDPKSNLEAGKKALKLYLWIGVIFGAVLLVGIILLALLSTFQ